MNCKDCLQQISSYLDGEIEPELKRHLEEHLRKCHHCHVVFDSTRKTIELYCDGKLFPLPVEIRDRLHQTLRRRWQEKAG
ncbi:MAG: zf-HC2 domain-containing protein [Terriglobia bacterium]